MAGDAGETLLAVYAEVEQPEEEGRVDGDIQTQHLQAVGRTNPVQQAREDEVAVVQSRGLAVPPVEMRLVEKVDGNLENVRRE